MPAVNALQLPHTTEKKKKKCWVKENSETQLGHFQGCGGSRWKKQGLDVGQQLVFHGDTRVCCCERSATGPGQLLDSVVCHTGLVSSSPGAFSNGNNVVKSKAWSVEPPGSHLGGSDLIGSGETPQVHSCS